MRPGLCVHDSHVRKNVTLKTKYSRQIMPFYSVYDCLGVHLRFSISCFTWKRLHTNVFGRDVMITRSFQASARLLLGNQTLKKFWGHSGETLFKRTIKKRGCIFKAATLNVFISRTDQIIMLMWEESVVVTNPQSGQKKKNPEQCLQTLLDIKTKRLNFHIKQCYCVFMKPQTDREQFN